MEAIKVSKEKKINAGSRQDVVYKGREFYRFVGKKVQWKRSKSNNIVSDSLHNELEQAYNAATGRKSILVPSTKKKTKSELDKEILSLCTSGSLLQAVKLYKDNTGEGLKESKDYVDALYNKVKAKASEDILGQVYKTGKLKKGFVKNMKNLYNGNNALEVVKNIRETTGLGLKESKDLFESLIR